MLGSRAISTNEEDEVKAAECKQDYT